MGRTGGQAGCGWLVARVQGERVNDRSGGWVKGTGSGAGMSCTVNQLVSLARERWVNIVSTLAITAVVVHTVRCGPLCNVRF